MQIKEYRVLMPMSVDEYRIAQLYMIAKKSRLESQGNEHGVEIIKNEPYEDGPGGSGQYTYKIYHVGTRIPAWIRHILPASVLEAHEEAWNAYPYTKTRYTFPVIGDRLNCEIETLFIDDAGTTENLFQLSSEERRNYSIDVLDFVKDPIPASEYLPEEDPKLYQSEKTKRGPLTENWVEEHVRNNKPVMCAYKICRVEFKYWGLQTRVERFVHDFVLRQTLMRAHRQAWAWQDEWVGLDINDIRRFEAETAQYLSTVMAAPSPHANRGQESIEEDENGPLFPAHPARHRGTLVTEAPIRTVDEERVSMISDIFFDCCDDFPQEAIELINPTRRSALVRWNSDILCSNEAENDAISAAALITSTSKWQDKNASLLILIFHADLFPNASTDSKLVDMNTFRTTLEHLVTNHYPFLKGKIHLLYVTCGSEFASTISLLEGIFPSNNSLHHPSLGLFITANQQLFTECVESTIFSANKVVAEFLSSELGKSFKGEIFAVSDSFGGILLYEAMSRSAQEANEALCSTLSRNPSCSSAQSSPHFTAPANDTSPNPSVRSLHHYSFVSTDSREHSPFLTTSCNEGNLLGRNMSAPPASSRISSSGSRDADSGLSLSFRLNAVFLLGCPLAQVLMYKKLSKKDELDLRIDCDQLFNVYYPLDLCGMRLEPVLNEQLAMLPPLCVARYQRYPLGDGQNINFDHTTKAPMVWGDRRVDHQLFCPQEMNVIPPIALPNILHASYWESKDLVSFILRQFVRSEDSPFTCSGFLATTGSADTPPEFKIPAGGWNRRRTRFKVANLSANHRANDVIVIEGSEQVIHARFCYGPMDLVALSLETVLVYICVQGGEWYLNSTETTDKNGRLLVNLGKLLPVGVHSVRLIVQGDRSFIRLFVAVVPKKTPTVVFSIDGSLTGSVSVTGKDPRLRPGAVDLVRFWQQQGYMIIYLTARPDFSQRLIGAWLNQHNFPHGLLFFTPSLSTDPLRQKAQYLRHLADIGVKIQAGYGSAKDIPVYSTAGLNPEQIFIVGTSSHKRRGCVVLEDGYSQHLYDLQTGKIPIAQYVCSSASPSSAHGGQVFFPTTAPTAAQNRAFVNRTFSFTPRSGRYQQQQRHALPQQSSSSSASAALMVEKERAWGEKRSAAHQQH